MPELVLKVKNCPACYRDIKWDDLLFYQCGHRVCSVCYPELPHKRRCPMCNLDRPGDVPRRIFLSIEDIYVEEATEDRRNVVIEGLKKIDEDTPMISIEKALAKIKKAQRNAKDDPEATEKLLQAIHDLERKFVPTFRQFSELQEQISSLTSENESLKLSKAKHKERISKLDTIISTAKEETERQRQRAETYRTTVKQKDSEIAKLTEGLEQKDREMGLLNKKLRVLAKQHKQKSPNTPDPDASLQVENVPQDILNDGIKRRSKVLQGLTSESQPHRAKRRKECVDPI